ncbi:MAG: adenylyltransferase/cytidyltransferase family protein [Rhodobacteraceae bacterium]|nr:adenylyltransferase/cytidyltransferase family protein [Paracoccaceae bacterium]
MTTVFTEGVFDLLHANHLRLLSEARAMGTRLIVGVTPDEDAIAYKRRPILTLPERMDHVRATGMADLVVECPTMFGAHLSADFLDRHGIGLVVYGGTGWEDFYRVPIARGIFRRVPYHAGISTSMILARIAERGEGDSKH